MSSNIFSQTRQQDTFHLNFAGLEYVDWHLFYVESSDTNISISKNCLISYHLIFPNT